MLSLSSVDGSYQSVRQSDDITDEGQNQNQPDEVQAGVNISTAVFENPEGPRPTYPYAAMIYE
jgi:hypothetical protein